MYGYSTFPQPVKLSLRCHRVREGEDGYGYRTLPRLIATGFIFGIRSNELCLKCENSKFINQNQFCVFWGPDGFTGLVQVTGGRCG